MSKRSKKEQRCAAEVLAHLYELVKAMERVNRSPCRKSRFVKKVRS